MFPEHAYDLPIFSFYQLPEIYTGQWITGLIWTAPFILFAFLPLSKLFKYHRKRTIIQKDEQSLSWIIIALTVGLLGAFAPLLAFFWSAMRYQADFMPFLLTLGILGFWQGYQILKSKPNSRRKDCSPGGAIGVPVRVGSGDRR